MKLPLIRSATEYIETNDASHIEQTVAVLEHMSQAKGWKDEELEVIGELISNLLGGVDVANAVASGTPKSQALNEFMGRVLGSIDR